MEASRGGIVSKKGLAAVRAFVVGSHSVLQIKAPAFCEGLTSDNELNTKVPDQDDQIPELLRRHCLGEK